MSGLGAEVGMLIGLGPCFEGSACSWALWQPPSRLRPNWYLGVWGRVWLLWLGVDVRRGLDASGWWVVFVPTSAGLMPPGFRPPRGTLALIRPSLGSCFGASGLWGVAVLLDFEISVRLMPVRSRHHGSLGLSAFGAGGLDVGILGPMSLRCRSSGSCAYGLVGLGPRCPDRGIWCLSAFGILAVFGPKCFGMGMFWKLAILESGLFGPIWSGLQT